MKRLLDMLAASRPSELATFSAGYFATHFQSPYLRQSTGLFLALNAQRY